MTYLDVKDIVYLSWANPKLFEIIKASDEAFGHHIWPWRASYGFLEMHLEPRKTGRSQFFQIQRQELRMLRICSKIGSDFERYIEENPGSKNAVLALQKEMPFEEYHLEMIHAFQLDMLRENCRRDTGTPLALLESIGRLHKLSQKSPQPPLDVNDGVTSFSRLEPFVPNLSGLLDPFEDMNDGVYTARCFALALKKVFFSLTCVTTTRIATDMWGSFPALPPCTLSEPVTRYMLRQGYLSGLATATNPHPLYLSLCYVSFIIDPGSFSTGALGQFIRSAAASAWYSLGIIDIDVSEKHILHMLFP